MSAAAYISGPSSLTHLRKLEKGAAFHPQKASFRGGLRQFPIDLFLRSSSYGWRRRSSTSKSIRRFSPVMEWQDCRWSLQKGANLHILDEPLPKNASRLFLQELEPYGDMTCTNFSEIEVAVPCSVAYQCYSDRETIPEWMPFISSVKVLQDKPDLSRWSLKYEVFGRNVEFSWLARNMQPIPNQKIHWRSLEGLPNRGAVRFFPKGPSACRVQLTVSYEVPEILSPVASALKPFLEGLLANGLERFATVARDYQRKIPQR